MDEPRQPIRKEAGLENAQKRAEVQLSDAFSRNLLDMDEFERRMESLQKAMTLREVQNEVSDLGARASQQGLELTEEKVLSCILSSRKFQGQTLAKPYTDVGTILGETTLDYRETELPPGETHLHVKTVLGTSRIIVPPDLTVITDITPVLGEVSEDRNLERRSIPGEPVLRITGGAVLGEIKIKVRRGNLFSKN